MSGQNKTGKQFHRSALGYERWIRPHGDPFADGSIDNPYNAESAAQQGFDSEWEQACNDCPDVEDVSTEGIPFVIHAEGGTYDGATTVNLPATRSVFFTTDSAVVAPSVNFLWSIDSTTYGLSPTPLSMVFWGGGIWQFPSGSMQVEDDGARNGGINMVFERVGFDIIDQGVGGVASDAQVGFVEVNTSGALGLPDFDCYYCDRLGCDDDYTIQEQGLTRHSRFSGDFTCDGLAATPIEGFFGCRFDGDFDGPAGSAVFDDATRQMWDLYGGAFVGGASEDDYLDSDYFFLFSDEAQDLASGTTSEWDAVIPCDCEVLSIGSKATVAPIMTVGTCLATIAGAGNNLLGAANFDMETLPDATFTGLALTGTAADLIMAEGDTVAIAVVTGATLQGATGTNVRFAMRCRRLD